MNRTEKTAMIEQLKEKFESAQYFYIADSSALTVDAVNKLRGMCFEKDVEMTVVKNTLAIKALEQCENSEGFAELHAALKGPSTLMFSSTGNVPAKVIKEFRKKHEKPVLKAAYIDSDIFIGDQVDTLAALKSKEELIGDIVLLLQSPAKNVISGLKSAGGTLAGLLKTLETRAQS